jgi:hypothetical protein
LVITNPHDAQHSEVATAIIRRYCRKVMGETLW